LRIQLAKRHACSIDTSRLKICLLAGYVWLFLYMCNGFWLKYYIGVLSCLHLQISRETINVCKEYFRDDLTKADWQLVVELKKLLDIM
jgi:hypothetical protein